VAVGADGVPFGSVACRHTHRCLPAQFGFRTNAVVDFETRTGTLDPGTDNWRGAATAGWPRPTWR
jgi:hypothetical protein